MIKIFEKVIRENLAESMTETDFPLSYLKFSTVTSGSGLNDKIIFLVFKKSACTPFLCLKTVRNYGAKQAVIRNFHNLQKLNKLTVGSSHKHLFASAVCLHDDGENVFSVETACQGDRIGRDKNKLAVAILDYIVFHEYLAKKNENSLRNMRQMADETVTKSGLNGADQQKILEYFEKLPTANAMLPRIVQHGDLTPDNILLSKDGLCIVDYDDVGNTDIPGFDLFNLFRRFSPTDFWRLYREYFPVYFRKIGGTFDIDNYRGVLFLYNVIEYVQKKSHNHEEISGEKIISGFERLYPKT